MIVAYCQPQVSINLIKPLAQNPTADCNIQAWLASNVREVNVRIMTLDVREVDGIYLHWA